MRHPVHYPAGTGCWPECHTDSQIHIDAQDLAKQRRELLAVSLRIAAGSAIAETDVHVSVGPEREHAAVVVVKRLVNVQQHALCGWIDRPVGGPGELGDHAVALKVGVVDEEATVRRKVGVEGETKRPCSPPDLSVH